MKKFIKILALIIILAPLSGFSQKDRKYIREGNKLFKTEKFEDSEISYRKAYELAKDKYSPDFNIGDALYRQEKFEDAGKSFEKISKVETDKITKSKVFHNLGNSLLQNQKVDESIEAYKNALRNNPHDLETKYNLAYAQNLKKKQEEQKKDQKDDKEKKQQPDDKKKEENKEKQGEKDQGEKDPDDNKNKGNKNPEDNEQNQNKKEQQEQDKKEGEEKQQKPQPQKISKEDAIRLLEALANDEKKVQAKVKKDKASRNRIRVLKDW
ncbi:tetratricopeptide repeat protein [Bacteroidota bacterium]